MPIFTVLSLTRNEFPKVAR